MAEGNCSAASIAKCDCNRCQITALQGKNHPNMHIYQSYLEFARECLLYQDQVHQHNVPTGEAFLSQIRSFEGGKNTQRSLDCAFENFIKHYSRYVLKDTFDLGIKKSYYAVHKKVEAVLKERNIPAKEDDKTLQLIEAYKQEKNKLFSYKSSERNSAASSLGRIKKIKNRPAFEETSSTLCRVHTEASENTKPAQPKQKERKHFLERLVRPQWRCNPLLAKSLSESDPWRPQRRTFLQLKKRKLWREMHVAAQRKTKKKLDGSN